MDWGWLAPASRWCGRTWQFGGKGRQGRCGDRGEKSLQVNLLLRGVGAGEVDDMSGENNLSKSNTVPWQL